MSSIVAFTIFLLLEIASSMVNNPTKDKYTNTIKMFKEK